MTNAMDLARLIGYLALLGLVVIMAGLILDKIKSGVTAAGL